MTGLALVLAAGDENNFGDTRSGGLAGPTGLVIILFLVVATVFLIRNMNKRIRRLPERFDNEPSTGAGQAENATAEPTDTTADTK